MYILVQHNKQHNSYARNTLPPRELKRTRKCICMYILVLTYVRTYVRAGACFSANSLFTAQFIKEHFMTNCLIEVSQESIEMSV